MSKIHVRARPQRLRASLAIKMALLALALSQSAAVPAADEGAPLPPRASARAGATVTLAGDDAEIAFKAYGRLRPPVLVLVHGWSCDSRYWNAQIDTLVATHGLVTVDLAGHGDSTSGERRTWTMADFGADVAAVVEALALERVVLVGHAMGGTVVLEAARRLDERVVGVIGIDAFRDATQLHTEEQLEGLIAPLQRDFPVEAAAFAERTYFVADGDPQLRRWIVEDMADAPPDVALPALRGLLRMDYQSALAELRVPVLTINSSQTPSDAVALATLYPRLKVLGVDGTGHFPMLEKPAEINTLIGRVLEEWSATTMAAPLSETGR